MRVNSINCCYQNYGINRNATLHKSNNTAFRGTVGKIGGGLIGAGIASLAAIAALANPVSLVGGVVTLLCQAGGAAAGGKIGDKIEGKDD